MKYIAWIRDYENCKDRLLYAYSIKEDGSIGTTSFVHLAKRFDNYPKNIEEQGFTVQEVKE